MVYQVSDSVTISGREISLESPIDIAYARGLAEIANDRTIRDSIGAHGFPFPYTEEDAVDFIERNRKSGTLPFAVDFLILYQNSAAGVVGLGDINYTDRKAHIGYWVGSKFRGLGIATEATSLVCSYAFTTLKLHRLETKVLEGNVSSMQVLINNGFEVEGTEREAFFADNQFKSFILFAKLNA